MSVPRLLFSLMLLCVGVVSCVNDPDPSLHAAPEIQSPSVEIVGTTVILKSIVSRYDNIRSCGFYLGSTEEQMERYGSELPSKEELSFSVSLQDLTYDVRYCFRSFISSGYDEKLSDVQRFEIERQTPFPSLLSLRVKDRTTVTCEYSVADVFSGDMIICGLCWNETGTPTIQSPDKTLDGSEYGSRTVDVTYAFDFGKTYHFRVYAVNGKGTAYSEEMTIDFPILFDDKVLSDWMVSNWDTNSDGMITAGEAARVTKIDILSDKVTSLVGIEYLPNLDTLRCRGLSCGVDGGSGALTEVDLRSNVSLTCLDLSNNRITSVDLSPLKSLKSLVLAGNVSMDSGVLDESLPFIKELKSLDISSCPNVCQDLSLFPSLEEFHYDSRTGIKDVETLFRQKRDLRRLYVSDALKDEDKIYLLSDLEVLDCVGSSVRKLDMRYNSNLRSLNIDNCNQITFLDLNTNPKVTELHCMSKSLSRLELLEGHEIDGVNVNLDRHRHIPESVKIVYTPRIEDEAFRRFLLDNYDFDNDSFVSLAEAARFDSMIIPSEKYPGIASLHGVEMFTALRRLDVSGQRMLVELNLSKNCSLTCLVCDSSSLESLDLSHCPALVSLYAQNTMLESLDLSANPNLKEAYLSHSPIKTLYITSAQKASLNLICDPDTEIIVVE